MERKANIQNKCDSWKLIQSFERVHDATSLNPSAQSVWFALWRKCNSLGWPISFYLKGESLAADANVTRNTLRLSIDNLCEVGLIKYTAGVRRGVASMYQLIDTLGVNNSPLTNDTTQTAVSLGVSTGVSLGVNNSPLTNDTGVKISPPHNTNTDTNKKTNTLSLPNGGEKEIFFKNEIEYWDQYKLVWENIYQHKKQARFIWEYKQYEALKILAQLIKQFMDDTKVNRGVEHEMNRWQVFIFTALWEVKNKNKERWLQDFFSLSMIAKHAQTIAPLFIKRWKITKEINNPRAIEATKTGEKFFFDPCDYELSDSRNLFKKPTISERANNSVRGLAAELAGTGGCVVCGSSNILGNTCQSCGNQIKTVNI